MRIDVARFGRLLLSRPDGREAFLAMRASFRPATGDEPVELDFAGVEVVGPSWLDEVLTGLRQEYGERVRILPTENATLAESMKVIDGA